MARYEQKEGLKGSQKWLQLAVATRSPALLDPIADAIGEPSQAIRWLSPLKEDAFAEYRDQAFLERLGVDTPNRSLRDFWPRGGPQWDGLGASTGGQIILIEAKAHITEAVSGPTQATEPALSLIRQSLEELRDFLNVSPGVDWSEVLYQHNNRLAHLYFLREVNGVPAWLFFVNFVGDQQMNGPVSAAEWAGASDMAKSILGWPRRHRLMKHVVDLPVSVEKLL